MNKKEKCLWLKVTNDEYELPLAVADSSRELSRILGLSANGVSEQMSRAKSKGKQTCFRKVVYEDGDWIS